MRWHTKQVPSSALIARLNNKEVAAAREVLQGFLANTAVERDRLLQALTVLILDIDAGGDA
jgi:hypothetical protein